MCIRDRWVTIDFGLRCSAEIKGLRCGDRSQPIKGPVTTLCFKKTSLTFLTVTWKPIIRFDNFWLKYSWHNLPSNNYSVAHLTLIHSDAFICGYHKFRLSYIHICKWEIHMRICQGFHKIRFHRSPLLQIQPQSEKLSCKNEPDFMLFVLVLQIVSV